MEGQPCTFCAALCYMLLGYLGWAGWPTNSRFSFSVLDIIIGYPALPGMALATGHADFMDAKEGKMPEYEVNLDRLFKLRLIIARFGEMDKAKWWNTRSMLGSYGAKALVRGFPKTHCFAQARVVFSVARHRCREVYDHPHGITLWDLPADLDDQFESRWFDWLENLDEWEPFFQQIEFLPGDDLLTILEAMKMLNPAQADAAQRLRRSAEGRSVALPEQDRLSDDQITMLAAGFFRGEPGKPAIPYSTMKGVN